TMSSLGSISSDEEIIFIGSSIDRNAFELMNLCLDNFSAYLYKVSLGDGISFHYVNDRFIETGVFCNIDCDLHSCDGSCYKIRQCDSLYEKMSDFVKISGVEKNN